MANNDMWAAFGKDILDKLESLNVRVSLIEQTSRRDKKMMVFVGGIVGSIITLLAKRFIFG